MLWFLTLVLAFAGKPDACENIKPEQQLETHRQQQIEGMVKVGIVGLGRGEAQLDTDTDVEFDTQLLHEDDLAQAWFIYQLCVLERDGVLSPGLHDTLMRKLFGVEAAPAAPAPDAVAPTQVAAVDVSEEDGTSIGVVRGTSEHEGLEMYLATELDKLQRRKYPRVSTIVFEADGKSFGVGSTVSATATVMCGSDPRKVVIPPATATGTMSYKGRWLAKKILKQAGCK